MILYRTVSWEDEEWYRKNGYRWNGGITHEYKIMTNAKKTVHVKISVDSLRRTFDCTKKLKQFGQFREKGWVVFRNQKTVLDISKTTNKQMSDCGFFWIT